MIDPRAVVDPDAKLAEDVEVGPYSIIEGEVEIGAGTRIGPHVVIKNHTRIGKNNQFFQFSSIGEAPQDKKYDNEATLLEIGDGNTFREFCTLNRGTVQDLGATKIGNDNWVMAYVHIAHDCIVGDDVILANCVTLAGHVHVGDHAILGGFAGVHQFCSIGTHAFIGNNCGITRDVPPYVLTGGQPASPKGVNSEGLKRRDFTPDAIKNIKRAYKLIYRSGLKLEDAKQQLIQLEPEQPELSILVEFLNTNRRSLLR